MPGLGGLQEEETEEQTVGTSGKGSQRMGDGGVEAGSKEGGEGRQPVESINDTSNPDSFSPVSKAHPQGLDGQREP